MRSQSAFSEAKFRKVCASRNLSFHRDMPWLASHAVVFRGLELPPPHKRRLWGGGNSSPLKTTAWEAMPWWVPEAFHARFPVSSLQSDPRRQQSSSSHARKNFWYPYRVALVCTERINAFNQCFLLSRLRPVRNIFSPNWPSL